MAFPKALDTKSEEYLEYVEALLRYKLSCSKAARARKFKLSQKASERLLYFDTIEAHKQECKVYAAAKLKYEAHCLAKKFHTHELGLSARDAAILLEEKIPLSMQDMIAQRQQDTVAEGMSTEEFEHIAKVARSYQSTKEQFLSSSAAAPALEAQEFSSTDSLDVLEEDLFGDEALGKKRGE